MSYISIKEIRKLNSIWILFFLFFKGFKNVLEEFRIEIWLIIYFLVLNFDY